MVNREGNQFQILEQVDQSVMDSFFFYCALLSLKLLFSICMVTVNRIRHQVASNPEDVVFDLKHSPTPNAHVVRCNRVVANDLENIVPFFFVGLMFCMVAGYDFDPFYAKNMFRVFTASRFLTSFCHYFSLQPLRSVTWGAAFFTNILLIYHVAMGIGESVTKYL